MLINKENLPLVAEDFMNDTHIEDVDIINELHENSLNYLANKTEENKDIVIQTYTKWFEHTVNHFQTEEKKMLELNFPPYFMHKSEHDRCLEEMNYVLDKFKQTSNEAELISYLENNLVNWLINHINTMDTVTAMFFKTGLSPCSMH